MASPLVTSNPLFDAYGVSCRARAKGPRYAGGAGDSPLAVEWPLVPPPIAGRAADRSAGHSAARHPTARARRPNVGRPESNAERRARNADAPGGARRRIAKM